MGKDSSEITEVEEDMETERSEEEQVVEPWEVR